MSNDFASSMPLGNSCICEGGKWSKYFKDERRKLVSKAEDYCPVCHPNLAQPIVANADQIEIEYEEYLELRDTEGWTLA